MLLLLRPPKHDVRLLYCYSSVGIVLLAQVFLCLACFLLWQSFSLIYTYLLSPAIFFALVNGFPTGFDSLAPLAVVLFLLNHGDCYLWIDVNVMDIRLIVFNRRP